ncbi:ATP-dependent RNA helicase dbp2-like [Drosophila innubila]|uniref:ATP-dependent RNA helicase dbp2-like n=1 Tax=Drosophila innubila TaxID=198719 RepID=UPI00148E6654|nr:ATP-dependent RNA helicase dbp2-like [Drosophila innubila]
MRLILLLFTGSLCLAFCYALASKDVTVQDDKVIALLNLADQGEGHQNEGQREARAGGYCCRGGYGRGGYGGGGYGRGGYGRGGYGRGGYGGGGYGRGGYGRGGYGRGGYGRYGR